MGTLLRFLVLACVVQVAGAQGLFKGFIPDENGTNLDAPSQKQKVAPGTLIKDCAECPEMVVLKGGSFEMGDEFPTHTVSIKPFAIAKTEVTQEQWNALMGTNPSLHKQLGLNLPVEDVSWLQVQYFIRKLNQKTGQKYRLPSEAEWDYAARAGTTTRWSFGDGVSKLVAHAWYSENSEMTTQTVGKKLANPFGLYDMYGNVWEWVEDCWHENYVGAPTDGSAWLTNCREQNRVIRGGSWASDFGTWTSSFRSYSAEDESQSYGGFGFRLARDL